MLPKSPLCMRKCLSIHLLLFVCALTCSQLCFGQKKTASKPSAASVKAPVLTASKPSATPVKSGSRSASKTSTAHSDTLKWKLYETGDATYYSARTHGRMMASGERYDKNGLFCAHKKLPFGTKIRVVNKKNGKEVVVLVKDRGPFAQGRVIDLSNKAAEQLDMLRAGVVPVELWIGED